MNNESMFSYTYSAKQNEEAAAIRNKYLSKQESKLDELKALDRRVKKPANVFGYLFGSISAVIMGCGMSLVMTDLGAYFGMADSMIPGIVIGVVGLALALLTYPVYKRILASRKKKYADQIIALSDELMDR